MKSTPLRWKTLCKSALALLMLALAGQARPSLAYAQTSCPDEEVTAQEKAVHYSLYYEDFKNGNFQSALPNLKWIIHCAPGFPEQTNDDRNFTRLVEAYEGLAEAATDEALKRAYLDSALAVFDTAVPTLQEVGAEVSEFEWLLNKGRFLQTHAQQMPELAEQVADIYLQAYEMAPDQVDAYYVRYVIDDYVRNEQKQEAVDFMDEVEGRFSGNAELMGYITQIRNSLFKSPEERMAFLEDQVAKHPENADLVSELFDIYMRLQHRAKAREMGNRLLELQPSARTYRQLAEMHLGDGEAQEAFALYQKALELPGAEKEARDIYYNMGIAQQQMGRLANARTYFRKALEVDPNFGRAYIAIGDLYATSVANCGSFEREDRAVYWLAVDYYEKARSADPSVAASANQKIGTYRRSFPDQEALFFKGWKPGQSYAVDYGCYAWIGETTTVRQP